MGVNIEQRNRIHDVGGFYPYVYDRRITLDEVCDRRSPQHSVFYRRKPQVALPGADSIRTMAEILTLQTRKSTEHVKAPRQRRKAPRFLTEPQVEDLRQTVKKTSRNPHRDSTMILVAYRHGLRVGEVTDLRWEDVHLDRAEIYVRRLKSSKSTMHPLQSDELRALRRLRREKTSSLSFVFISAQGGPLSIKAVEYMLKRAGQAAGIPHVHPHMLRHGCGYRLRQPRCQHPHYPGLPRPPRHPPHRDLHRVKKRSARAPSPNRNRAKRPHMSIRIPQ
jgi:integrase